MEVKVGGLSLCQDDDYDDWSSPELGGEDHPTSVPWAASRCVGESGKFQKFLSLASGHVYNTLKMIKIEHNNIEVFAYSSALW